MHVSLGRVGPLLGLLGVFCGPLSLRAVAPQVEAIGVRQIVLASEADAADVRDRLLAGARFDVLAREESLDPSTASRGGFLGRVSIRDLRPEFGNALAGLSSGEVSRPVRFGSEYLLFEVLTEEATEWIELEETGFRAAGRGRDAEAFRSFETALERAEAFGPGDYRVGRSLANLGELHRMRGNAAEAETLLLRAQAIYEALIAQGEAFGLDLAQTLNSLGLALSAGERHADAETAYRRALALREEHRGGDHPEVAITLNNMAESYLARGRHGEAGPLYERAVAILEDALGPDHAATVSTRNNLLAFRETLLPEVLERFAAIVFFSTFRDEAYDADTRAFEDMLPLAPLAEESYIEMKDAFFQSNLFRLAEEVLARGMERFPDYRQLPYHMGELLETLGRTREALSVFEAAARLSPADLDPAVDVQQRGLLHRRMGDMHTILAEFDEAADDYRRALEIDPATPGGHVSFGQMYYLSNRLDEALEQYGRAVGIEPDDFALQVNLAEAHIALGQWPEAAAAADTARRIDPSQPRSLYLRGTALVRMGDTDAGRRDLEEFARLERESQDEEHRLREAEAVNSDAVAALLAGEPEAAVDLFREGIAAHPEDRALRVNLGLTHIRLAQHRQAADVLQTAVDLGITDHYLVHEKLAEVYRALGDTISSQRHEAIYLEKRDADLSDVLIFAP